jgi:hypothetical protein
MTPHSRIAGARHCRGAPLAHAVAICTLSLGLLACQSLNWPWHRAGTAHGLGVSEAAHDAAGACAELGAQIRESLEAQREAPTTSVNPEIVGASQARAERRIDQLQSRYEALDCPAEELPGRARLPPLQPAPGAPGR